MRTDMVIAIHAMGICKDMNPRLKYVFDVLQSLKDSDKNTHIVLHEGFNSVEEIQDYQRRKLMQLFNFSKNLKEDDKMKSMESEQCRVIFRDPIIDDSWWLKKGE